MNKYIEIGKIVNTHGIKGFVKVIPYTDDVKRFDKLKTVCTEVKGQIQTLTVEQVMYSKNAVLIKFKEIADINAAEAYRNCMLKVDRKDAIKLPKDTYFIADLIGLDVYTDSDEYLGKVDDIFSAGSKDVYVVKDDTGKQILLPAIADVLKTIDIENEKIIVHLLEGLR